MDKEKLLKVAEEGAEKYHAAQMDHLKRMVAIDSGSRYEEGNAKLVEVVDELLSSIPGTTIEHFYYEGYGKHVVARLKPENPQGKIIVNCHLDTVFHPGDTAKHPYREEGDVAYGLGVVDCKGGVAVSAYAIKIMAEAGMLPNKEIVMIYNCDEEIGTPTGKEVFEKEIDGTEMAFIFEPSREGNGVLTARKGAVSFTIETSGVKAHAGVNYLDGRSATVELADKILKLIAKNDHERGIQFNVGALYGGEDGVGVVSSQASAKVGVRVANQADIDRVKEILAELEKDVFIEGTTTKIIYDKIGTPMERTEGNVRLYELVKKAGAMLGDDMPEQSTGGSGDSAYFTSKGIPTVDALGPYMYKIHSTEESMKLSSVKEKTILFCTVLGIIDQEW